jgi:nesprin-1
LQHALIHETSEEWEQCERKLREVKAWIEKCKGSLEAAAGKKRSLRDQLSAREKMLADISVQRSKIEISVEKLQVIYLSIVLLFYFIINICHIYLRHLTLYAKHHFKVL